MELMRDTESTIDKPGCTGCNACLYRLGQNQDNGCVLVETYKPIFEYMAERGENERYKANTSGKKC